MLLRARAIAGNLTLGEDALSELAPFVFRRGVDPGVAAQLFGMVTRARVELSVDLDRDLKHGAGGIRDLEMFVQAMQLIWGGVITSYSIHYTKLYEHCRPSWAKDTTSLPTTAMAVFTR